MKLGDFELERNRDHIYIGTAGYPVTDDLKISLYGLIDPYDNMPTGEFICFSYNNGKHVSLIFKHGSVSFCKNLEDTVKQMFFYMIPLHIEDILKDEV